MNKNLLIERVRYGLARDPDFEALGLDEVKAIKSDNGEIQYRFVERTVNLLDDQRHEYDASTEHRDSMGDRITVAGWDTKRINVGVMPFFLSHRADQIMGVVESARHGVSATDKVPALIEGVRIYKPDIYADSELGKTVQFHHSLIKAGLMPGSSVGFIPLKTQWPNDDEERAAMNVGRFGQLYLEQEQLELSATPIPCNRHANERKSLDHVKSLVKAGTISQDAADYWLKVTLLHPDEWLEKNCPSIRRKTFAFAVLPSWVKGAKNAEESAAPEGACCNDAKAALADTVRDVIRAEVPSIVREEVRVLRSKNSDDAEATVPTSRAESTISRGTDAPNATEAGGAGKPGESRSANPRSFHRRLMEDLLHDMRNLNASGSSNGDAG